MFIAITSRIGPLLPCVDVFKCSWSASNLLPCSTGYLYGANLQSRILPLFTEVHLVALATLFWGITTTGHTVPSLIFGMNSIFSFMDTACVCVYVCVCVCVQFLVWLSAMKLNKTFTFVSVFLIYIGRCLHVSLINITRWQIWLYILHQGLIIFGSLSCHFTILCYNVPIWNFGWPSRRYSLTPESAHCSVSSSSGNGAPVLPYKFLRTSLVTQRR